jgi:hypothetical protein
VRFAALAFAVIRGDVGAGRSYFGRGSGSLLERVVLAFSACLARASAAALCKALSVAAAISSATSSAGLRAGLAVGELTDRSGGALAFEDLESISVPPASASGSTPGPPPTAPPHARPPVFRARVMGCVVFLKQWPLRRCSPHWASRSPQRAARSGSLNPPAEEWRLGRMWTPQRRTNAVIGPCRCRKTMPKSLEALQQQRPHCQSDHRTRVTCVWFHHLY